MHETRARASAAQNGQAEEKDRTLIEAAGTKMIASGLASTFWTFAMDEGSFQID